MRSLSPWKDIEMTDLKPCPFCGGEVKIEGGAHKSIFCIRCRTFDFYDADTERMARKWNTRHYPPEVQQAVERMKPKKVIPEKVYWAPKNRRAYFIRFLCPTCGGIANRATNREFCNNNECGQALDWSE